VSREPPTLTLLSPLNMINQHTPCYPKSLIVSPPPPCLLPSKRRDIHSDRYTIERYHLPLLPHRLFFFFDLRFTASRALLHVLLSGVSARVSGCSALVLCPPCDSFLQNGPVFPWLSPDLNWFFFAPVPSIRILQ